MSRKCKTAPQVIAVDDDIDDVEVVFTNLDKTHVYRNLMQQKISQELELLQVMSKQSVPTTFVMFKELARKLDFQYGDDVIASAWQRIVKKISVKLSNTLNNQSPLGLLRHLRFSPQGNISAPSSFITSTTTSPSPSLFPSISSPVPVALIASQQVGTRTKCSKNIPNFVHTIVVDDDASEPPNNITCNKREVKTQKRKSSQLDTLAKSDNTVSRDEQSCTDSDISRTGGGKYIIGESNRNESSLLNTPSTNSCDSATSKQSPPGVENKLTKMSRKSSSKQSVSPESSKLTKKSRKSSSKQSVSPESPKLTKKIRKSSSKEYLSAESPIPSESKIAENHVGVKAKIIRKKQTSSSNSKKKLSPNNKMSDADFKKFKAEQKRLKLEQKREFEIEQLQKVHDRLVDVIIPKYYGKVPDEKG
ncbi:uncharacterized protein LOC128990615 [Macrosteles quadrilineatus]|uniref:uncharacterized protein LOC128990615 n=1 Tax=Macrosteles quadrilineatus TaxID=74068 RepID=UPI0023E0A45D|nr:uncharacterized protein LOC128990615 [Macrosteles quadrilineatus]